MSEQWKPIKGYEGFYEISNFGRVKSIKRVVTSKTKNGKPSTKMLKERILSLQKSTNGYVQVGLSKEKEVRIYRVHRLVADAFIANPDNLPEVNHIDEDRTNNNADNLEWCTHEYNNNYGNKPAKGEKNGMARLNKTQIQEIRRRRASGESLKSIAADYGISLNHVCNISQGKRWAHEVYAD